MSKITYKVGGLNFIEALLIVFIVLKLTNVISWSWWWVLSPLWIPIVLGILIAFIVFIIYSIFYLRNR